MNGGPATVMPRSASQPKSSGKPSSTAPGRLSMVTLIRIPA